MEFGKQSPAFNSIDMTYVSSKVARVRWKPDGEYFVTGSYSEVENTVELWKFPKESLEMDCPRRKCKMQIDGDVSELKFVDKDRFLYSTTSGGLFLVSTTGDELKVVETWNEDLLAGNSIYGFDINDQGTVALIMADGCITCYTYTENNATKTLVGSLKDNTKCVSFLRHHELAQGNLRGQISIWDLREDLDTPALNFAYNRNSAVGVTCIAPFPVRKHMLVAAGMDGTITTWDLRKHQTTETIYSAHNKAVTSLTFHNMRPTNVFTSSFSGEVWHWKNFYDLLTSNVTRGERGEPEKNNFNSTLHGQVMNGMGEVKPDVSCLIREKKFPTNSCDVIDDRLVCSTDNDCLIFVKPLQLR